MRFRVILWLSVFAIWLLLVDTASAAELLAGAVAATVAAWAGGLALAGAGERTGRAPRCLPLARACARQLAGVPADLWLLTRELLRAILGRHRPGRFHAVDLPDSPNGGQAAREIIGSLSPNTIVVGSEHGRLVVHQLVERAQRQRDLAEIGR